MELVVNGKHTQCQDGTTVAALLDSVEVGADTAGVAVAVNDTVVPRGRWNDTTLSPGDRVEVIHAVQGG